LKNLITLLSLVFLTHCSINQKAKQGSVYNYGVKGDGLHDDTEGVQMALDKNDTIYLPKGTYLVSHLIVKDNKTILTDGFETIIKQKSNHAAVTYYDADKSLICLTGSNIVIYKLTCEGNINSYQGEQNHGVLLLPTTKNITNVHLKGLNIKNMRGDGLCISNTRFFCADIVAENLTIQNVYRNGVSITSGHHIKVSNVDVKQSGMAGIDLEGEGTTDMPFENIRIEKALVGNIGVSGMNQKAKNITVKQLHVDGSLKGSNPPYKYMNPSGILIEKAENVSFDDVLVENVPEFAIYAGDVDTKNHLLSQNIVFNNVTLRKASLKETRYNAYVCVMGFTDVAFNNLNADIENDKTLFLGKSSTFKNTQQVKINKAIIKGGKNLAQKCQLIGKNLTTNTEGVLLSEMTEASLIEDSDITCKRMTDRGEAAQKPKVPVAYNTKKLDYKTTGFELKNCKIVEKE
jgi:Pectate lyase superfamily protein